MRKKFSGYIRLILCSALIIVGMLCGTFSTAYADNETEIGSLTLICTKEDVILENLHWNIYRVGSRQGSEYVLEGDFIGYPIDLTDFSAEGMSAVAETLETYAIIDDISPVDSGYTNEKGVLKFTGLKKGLYLVSGDVLTIGDTTYVPSTILFEIGNEGTEYDLNAYPKIVFRTQSSEIVKFTVKKMWLNNQNQPMDGNVEITAGIYCDGELDREIVLNEENDWTYSWGGQADSDWRVKEIDVPEGFTVIYDSNETQFAIVNTQKDIISTVTTTVSSTTQNITTATEITTTTTAAPPPATSKATTTPTTSPETKVTTTKKQDENKIPQTGQLWWPVPVFGLAGVISIAAGLKLNSIEGNESEDEKK